MESKIKNKAFLKPGTTFISKRTGNFKYVDKDGTECWVVPMSRYYAKETILRGQPVAICQARDFAEDDIRANDTLPYVKVYNPDVDEFCIGVATNYVNPDEIVNIQNRGKFDYLTKDSKKAKAEGDNPREVYIDTSKETWIYNGMRGQTVYVCAQPNGNNFPNNHDSKVNSVDSNNTLTYDFIDSVYTTKNTIQLGHLTDAPVSFDLDEDVEDRHDQVVTIELDVTGDTRGPLDNTQHILTLGEDISFSYVDEDKDLADDPNGNWGVLNEIKVVAMASKDPEKPVLYSLIRDLNEEYCPDVTEFVAVRNIKGKVVIIPFGTEEAEIPEDFNAWDLTQANDIGYRTLVKSYCNEVTIADRVAKLGDLPDAIKAAFESFEEVGEVTIESRPDDDGKYFVGSNFTGWFDIYESQNLKAFLNVATKSHGSSAVKGTAILADIRDFDRTNAIGVVLSNQPGLHPYNNPDVPNTIKVIKQGRVVTKGNLVPGAEYYLSTEGRISIKNQAWYDTSVKIGTAENDHTLLVDIQPVQHDYSGATPIGYVRPCIDGNVPERGFILADGVTAYSLDDYGELYDYLLSFYTKEELQTSEEEGTFVIPKILIDAGTGVNQIAQIKYLSNGLYNNLPRAPSMRFTGKFENGKVPDFNISKLVHYGTLEQSRIAPTLENIDIRLFYWDDSTENIPEDAERTEFADRYSWREIPVGFHNHNADTLWGFEWIVLQDDGFEQDGLYRLHMHIADGLGVCKLSGHRGPISLEGKTFKILVTAKNLWTREFSLFDESNVATSMEVDTNVIPPSVNAIKEYYRRRVETGELEVAEARIERLSVGEIVVDDKVIIYSEDLEAHTTKDASAEEVHGLLNQGVKGNLNAKKLDGLMVGAGGHNITENHEFNERDYIPYIEVDEPNNVTKADEANVRTLKDVNGTLISTATTKKVTNASGTHLLKEDDFGGVRTVKNVTKMDNTELVKEVKVDAENVDISYKEESNKKVTVKGIDKLVIKDIEVSNEEGTAALNLGYTELFNMVNASTISSKKDFKEVINPELNALVTEAGRDLVPTSPYDEFGHKVTNDEGKVEIPEAVYEFGEALQALYELPISSFDYKTNEYKRQLGILVERVGQVKDLIGSKDGFESEEENPKYYGHPLEGHGNFNFNYSEKELKSIVDYLNLTTNKKELGQELRATVGILLKAASETQERLLNVEASVYGKDASTIPGDREGRHDEVLGKIDESLQESLTNIPLYFGLNRLMRTICLELFDTTDLEQIEAETIDNLVDTEADGRATTIKSRLDLVDDKLSKIASICSGLTKIYKENFNVNLTLFEPVLKGENVIESETKNIEDVDPYKASIQDEYDPEDSDVKDSAWKSLPSKEEYENYRDLGYAEKNPATETHKPTKEDVKVLLQPVTKKVDLTELITGQDDDTKDIHFEILDYDPITHLPKVKEKAVANLAAKVERMNQKLSEITKVIYGKDEVLADANTITTLRRNIKNLIDDLYPNEDLSDVVLTEDGLFNPFRKSSGNGRNLDSENVGNESTPADKADETVNGSHYSIIRYLSKELFNYKTFNNYANYPSSGSPTGKGSSSFAYKAESENENVLTVSANYLKMKDDQDGLGKAYSYLQYLSDAIGVKNILVESFQPDLLEVNKGSRLVAGNDAFVDNEGYRRLAKGSAWSYQFNEELKFKEYKIVNTRVDEQTTVQEIAVGENTPTTLGMTTTTEALLSRKSKSLAARTTTVEAALDDISNAFWFTGSEDRFEKTDFYSQFANLIEKADQGNNTHLPELEDIVRGSLAFTNKGVEVLKSNLELLTILKNKYTVINVEKFDDKGYTNANNYAMFTDPSVDENNNPIIHTFPAEPGIVKKLVQVYSKDKNNREITTFVPIIYIDGDPTSYISNYGKYCLIIYNAKLSDNIEEIGEALATNNFDSLPVNISTVSDYRNIELLSKTVKWLNERIKKDEPEEGDVLTSTNSAKANKQVNLFELYKKLYEDDSYPLENTSPVRTAFMNVTLEGIDVHKDDNYLAWIRSNGYCVLNEDNNKPNEVEVKYFKFVKKETLMREYLKAINYSVTTSTELDKTKLKITLHTFNLSNGETTTNNFSRLGPLSNYNGLNTYDGASMGTVNSVRFASVGNMQQIPWKDDSCKAGPFNSYIVTGGATIVFSRRSVPDNKWGVSVNTTVNGDTAEAKLKRHLMNLLSSGGGIGTFFINNRSNVENLIKGVLNNIKVEKAGPADDVRYIYKCTWIAQSANAAGHYRIDEVKKLTTKYNKYVWSGITTKDDTNGKLVCISVASKAPTVNTTGSDKFPESGQWWEGSIQQNVGETLQAGATRIYSQPGGPTSDPLGDLTLFKIANASDNYKVYAINSFESPTIPVPQDMADYKLTF